ncbi:MAG: ADP-ribosylglycohydrolase family protein [Acidobacteria bacterium]|nr:ADP-ribosylglycohydrolase family protein [Acidobacteriota bacterium]
MTDSALGCLLGTAAGDAMGLPYEGASRSSLARLRLNGHRWIFGRGMLSDDTEHAWMVTECLHGANGDVDVFQRQLARRFRTWFLTFPPAAGFATLRACLKLCLGFPPSRSGVFSAGNAPAMRSAIIGVYYRHDLPRLQAFVRASTRITHTDPKAECGALAVALAAAGRTELIPGLCPTLPARPRAGDGVTGYIFDTVPAALAIVAQYPNDFRAAIETAILGGGDTDTVAAITGAILGARLGEKGIPAEWINGICEWPRSIKSMRRLAAGESPGLLYPALVIRNMIFFLIALGHVLLPLRLLQSKGDDARSARRPLR